MASDPVISSTMAGNYVLGNNGSLGDNYADRTHTFYGDVQADRIKTNDIVLKGESIDERLRRIELLLKIPTRNIELEQKYAKLAKLWQEYSDALSDYELFEQLKGNP